ncbi:MAG: hypothetical protein D6714_05290 [Bacteroidetes bacterium]|nr:MAG: hypothetical protein D6714_05290 [Bacteroidota bacterium]
MKTTGSLMLLIPLLLSTAITTLHGQSEKTLVKSFNLNGNQFVLLDLEGNVDVKTWKGDLMRIQITVALENGTEAMLKSLVQAGRYNLKGDDATGEFVVTAPGLQRKVTVRGKELVENISYTVFAPENVTVRLNDSASTSKEDVKIPNQF